MSTQDNQPSANWQDVEARLRKLTSEYNTEKAQYPDTAEEKATISSLSEFKTVTEALGDAKTESIDTMNSLTDLIDSVDYLLEKASAAKPSKR